MAVLEGVRGGEIKRERKAHWSQNHHLEPSCHPTWIKSPSVMAAALLTRGFTLGSGVGRGQRVGALEDLA